MFTNSSFAFDILCIIVWFGLGIYYARKGFLATVVQLVGNLFSLIGAHQFSTRVAGRVFEQFLAGGLRTQLAENLAAGGRIDLSAIALRYAGFLPESFRESIVNACERSLESALGSNALALAELIVQQVLEPLLTPVISLVLFFITFALLRMVVSLLVTVLGLVNRLPVIGAVNHWLGWSAGALAALLDIYLVLCVVWAIIAVTGGNLALLNDTVLSGSLFYKAYNLFNPFL